MMLHPLSIGGRMTIKICLIGPAGSGKSTLAGKLFVELKERQFNTELVPEMIRFDIQRNGPMQDAWEQYRTRTKQADIEDNIPKSVEYVVVDSGTLTPFFYTALICNYADPRQRLVLKDMYSYLIDDLFQRRYDYVFYLPPTETYRINANILNDGTRTQSESDIDTLATHMELIFTKIHQMDNVHCINSPLDQRCTEILKIILGENYDRNTDPINNQNQDQDTHTKAV